MFDKDLVLSILMQIDEALGKIVSRTTRIRSADDFIGTLKEQVIYGRVFQNLQEVREAVRRFIDTYNREWVVEKNAFLSPWQARAHWLAQASLSRAA